MKECIKICAKANKSELLKEKSIKNRITQIKSQLMPFKIDCTCKSDLDYFKLCIIEKGVQNKLMFEQTYTDVSREMEEIWPIIEFKKKNEFIQNTLVLIKQNHPSFVFNEKEIFIPFFDELLNAFYCKETAILELPQFLKMIKNFDDKMIEVKTYRELPYQFNFLDVQFIHANELGFGFYVNTNHSIYVIDNEENVTRLPLSLSNRVDEIEPFRCASLVNAVLSKDDLSFVQWCIDSGQINEKVKKNCIKLLKKLKEEKR